MPTTVTLRWLDPTTPHADLDWQRVDDLIAARGWMPLNRHTSRVLLAEDAGMLAGFFVFQLMPFTGPVWVHPSLLGQGVAAAMAGEMYRFLTEAGARGWLATAEGAHGEELCKQFGMDKVGHPLYIKVPEAVQ